MYLKKRLHLLMMVCLLTIIVAVFPVHAMAEDAMPPSYQKVEETDTLELYVDRSTGYFALRDKGAGYTWWSNPIDRDADKISKGLSKMKLNSLLFIKIIDQELGNEAYKTGQHSSVKVQKIPNGIREVFHFPEEKITIPLDIVIAEDHMSVTIPVKDIREEGSKKILDVYVLPYFGAGGPDDEGYLFVPDSSGALIHFNNGKYMYSYNERIYGRDKAFVFDAMKINKNDIYLPVYGLKNGNHSFLAVIQDGDAIGSINAMANGYETSYNNIYSSFTLRSTDIQYISSTVSQKVIETTDPAVDRIEIQFYPLSGNESDYSGMARRYRDCLTEEMGATPLEDSKSPIILDIYGAVLKTKPILGLPFNVTEPLTTYNQSARMVKELKESEVHDMVVNYINWEENQLSNKIPAKIEPLSKLGGSDELKKLTKYLDSNDIEFFGSVSLISFAKNGNGHSIKRDAVRSLSQELSAQYFYHPVTYEKDLSKTTSYLLKPNKLANTITKLLPSFNKQDIYGISVGDVGSKLYSDFYRKKPVGRQETRNLFEDALKQIHSGNKPIMINGGFAYSLPYARYINNAPVKSSQFLIFDESVPFYQIALSGLAYFTVPAINQEASPTKMFLKAIETGSLLKYSLINRNPAMLKNTELDSLYSSNFDAWKTDIINQYREAKSVYEKVKGSRLYSHSKIADGVFVTRYENGLSVIVNYLDEAYLYEGFSIKPLSYLVIEGSE
ncbi:DUF5696 domain-containing protein [Paenibacillus alkalitolerans]|uniref:DUF5696 domain-containing protein n=1 Tax=Paenibacillus alkalitolerans TaxID=2799335 RepID=UPI002D7FE16C|nr:DUF5696 domain-containing protein [Paenibacillus alkalitolerans]